MSTNLCGRASEGLVRFSKYTIGEASITSDVCLEAVAVSRGVLAVAYA